MPLHGRIPARIFPVMNGWWPYGHGGLLPARSRPAGQRLRATGRSFALRAKALPPSRSPLRRAKGGRATGRSAKAGRPQHPARGFQIPWTPIIGFLRAAGPWRGSKRPFGLCRSRGNGRELSALRRASSSAFGTVLAGISPATPAAWSALLPPSATSPGRRVALSSTFLKHRTRACTWYRLFFCPDYRA